MRGEGKGGGRGGLVWKGSGSVDKQAPAARIFACMSRLGRELSGKAVFSGRADKEAQRQGTA